MNNLKQSIVTNLKTATGLDVYYENIVTSLTSTPCITYIPLTDISDLESKTQRYSRPSYRIKLWGNDLSTMSDYANKIDLQMFEDGYKRINYTELTYNGQIQMIFTYECLYREYEV